VGSKPPRLPSHRLRHLPAGARRSGRIIISSRSARISAAARGDRRARGGGHRIIAVGTTTTHTLEADAIARDDIEAGEGATDLFIYPGFQFRIVSGLLTIACPRRC
jgi:hypothetical protein